eukprot:298547-Chlamydomonas_euryale.AAC.1
MLRLERAHPCFDLSVPATRYALVHAPSPRRLERQNVEDAASSAHEQDDLLADVDVPDEFLDPLMATLMSDPVGLWGGGIRGWGEKAGWGGGGGAGKAAFV